MREIKFRAWGKYHGGIINKIMDYCHLNTKYNHFICEDLTNNDYGNIYCVEQYIGVKDRNGVEIYEGDIVKPFTYDTVLAQVMYTGKECVLASKRKDGGYVYWSFHKDQLEVVGNIHENPELLEEK